MSQEILSPTRQAIRILTFADIHQIKWLYHAVEEAVAKHKPDILVLVGDFLHGGVLKSSHYSVRECATRLAELPCQIVFIRGNHEMENWNPFVDKWIKSGRDLHIPHGEAIAFGPLVLVGFPCSFSAEEYFLMGRRNNTFETDQWLPQILSKYGSAALTCWLMHEPPVGTRLCEEATAGLDEWRDAIEQYQPWLTISGHDHETPVFDGYWRDTIKATLCINAGQPTRLTEGSKTPHCCVFDFEFASMAPSLPLAVTVTAHPWAETVILPVPGNSVN